MQAVSDQWTMDPTAEETGVPDAGYRARLHLLERIAVGVMHLGTGGRELQDEI